MSSGLGSKAEGGLYSGSGLVPVAPCAIALGVHANASPRKAQLDRSAGIGAKQLAPGLAIAREHVLARVAEAVAVADGEQRMARRHLLHELRRRRGSAAVVRHDQRICGQKSGRAQQKLALRGALDVPCEKHTSSRTL